MQCISRRLSLFIEEAEKERKEGGGHHGVREVVGGRWGAPGDIEGGAN